MQATLGQQQVAEAASFGERLVAYIIDAAVLFGIGMIVGLFVPQQGPATVFGLLVGVIYFAGFWSMEGATPGKMAMGLRVVDADSGDLISPGKAILRWVGYYLSALPLLLGFFWALWDPNHQGWHDKIAGTRVIKAR